MTILEFTEAFFAVMAALLIPVVLVVGLKWGLGKSKRRIRDREKFYKA